MNVTDSILVGYSFDTTSDEPVLIVGKKRLNESVEIINAFQGEEAKELYQRLITKKENKTDVE